MKKDNKLNKIKNETVRRIVGVFISLFTIYVSLNLVEVVQYDYFIYLARAINFVFSFFLGGLFTYVLYLMILIYGISLMLPKSNIKSKWGIFIAGVILFILGGVIVFANNVTIVDNQNYLTFENYGENFHLVYDVDSIFRVIVSQNPGIIGYTLVALFNSLMTYVGSYVIGIILLVVGFFLFLIKPTRYLIKTFNDYRNFNYKYFPKKSFTKAKDLTLTTTAIDSLEDSDSIEIETVKEEKQEDPRDDYFSRIKVEEDKKQLIDKYENEPPRVIPISVQEHFQDEPLKRAIYKGQSHEDDTPLKRVEPNVPKRNPSYDGFDVEQEKGTSISELNNMYQREHNRIESAIQPQKEEGSYREVRNDMVTSPTFSYLKDIEKEVKIKPKRKNRYIAPSLGLLENRTSHESDQKNQEVSEERTEIINQVLSDLDVKARVVSFKIGPSVTRFDIQTERSESIRGFDSYINDICIRLGGLNARFSPIVLGKTTSGLEIANAFCSIVNFKDCIQTLNRLPKAKTTNIPLGKDINNELLTVDLCETPHLLVSGATGSGKSIFMHSLIMTLVMRNNPDQLKLLLIDPKKVELYKYREIPHLLCPPIDIDDKEKPYEVLLKICDIMEERYRLFTETDCSKLKEYNEWAVQNGKDPLPVIVVVIDEYADLVEVNKRISEPVVRIGQKARAAGIHMVVATQRPSVNVINGVIKANIPSRVALLSSSYTDSNTIIDQGGAEKLIGNGDMLIKCSLLSNTSLVRCQGAFVSNMEIKAVCDYLRNNYGPDYDQEIMDVVNKPIEQNTSLMENVSLKEQRYGNDEDLYQEVKKWTMSEEYISMSRIQTTFAMGFNRASRIFRRLKSEGVISDDPATNSSKGSKVLIHNYDTKPHDYAGSIEQTTFKSDK